MGDNVENVLGFAVSLKTVKPCVNEICDLICRNYGMNSKISSCWLACLNSHSYNVSRHDEHFNEALNAADWLVPDGVGIILASRVFGGKIRQRVTGDDIFHGVLRTLNKRGEYRIFFMGSTEQTLKKIQNRITHDFKNLNVCGVYSPPFKKDYTPNEIDLMVSLINAAKPDVLWVAMTAPKQEKWLYDNITDLNVKFAGAIGAVFDFYAGNIPRAPQFMQKLGLEWLYRSYKQPRALGLRYLKSNPIFIGRLMYAWIISKVKK